LPALEAALARALAAGGVPGGCAAIIEAGRVAAAPCFGVRDRRSGAPATPDTVFRAGSISKSLTALGVLLLVEEGRLALDAPVAALLSEVAIDNAWAASDPVRLVHLLEHTAGLDDIAFHHYLLEGADVPLSEAVHAYGPYASRWRPGTRASYSNAGPILAGRILERASGRRFEDFMAERLTGPLGMVSAGWTRPAADGGRMSRSYREDGLTEEPFQELPGRPSGALVSTAADLARLPLLLLGRGTLDGVRLLRPESVARLETPSSTDAARAGLRAGYGLGVVSDPRGRSVFFGHEGSVDGFVAAYAYAPALGAGYVLMLNAPSDALGEAAALVRGYLERGVPAPAPAEAAPAAEAARFTGQYQSVTPRRSLLGAILGLTQWHGVRVDGAVLRAEGEVFRHDGGGLYRRDGDVAPTLALLDGPDGRLVHTGTGARRRVPPLEQGAKNAGLALFVLALGLALAHAVAWVPAALCGRLTGRGLGVRLWPALALASAAAAALLPLALLATDDLAVLGRPSPVAWAAFAVSLAAPALAAAGLVAALGAAPGEARPVRWLARGEALLAAVACAWLGAHGWLGLRIWEA